MSKKVHAVVPRRRFFGSWDVVKVRAVAARSTRRSQKCKKLTGSEHFWTFRCRFCVAGARDYAPCQKWAKREGFVAFPKTKAGVGHTQRIYKMSYAWQAQCKRHVHQSCSEVRALISWDGLHFGASDLQVCWDDVAWQVQHFTSHHFFVAGSVL